MELKLLHRIILYTFILFTVSSLTAEENINYIPVAGYEYTQFDYLKIYTPGAGIITTGDKSTFSGIYKHGFLSDDTDENIPDYYNSIDVMAVVNNGKHQIIANFNSESDQPGYGGWATFQAAAIYINHLVETSKLSLDLGIGAALGDFGIDLENGSNWPLIPVPFFHLAYNSESIESELSFISGPSLNIIIFPEEKLRFSGEFKMDKYRDFHDLTFNAALYYKFLNEDNALYDFAGICAGVKNTIFDFTPGGDDLLYEIQYYSIFAELDLTILKISGGYNFGGYKRYKESMPIKLDSGVSLSIQAMYQF